MAFPQVGLHQLLAQKAQKNDSAFFNQVFMRHP